MSYYEKKTFGMLFIDCITLLVEYLTKYVRYFSYAEDEVITYKCFPRESAGYLDNICENEYMPKKFLCRNKLTNKFLAQEISETFITTYFFEDI